VKVVGWVVVVVLPSGICCCLMELAVLRDPEMSWLKTAAVCVGVGVAFEGGRHPEGIVTGCLASPEHGMGGNHVGGMR
jgi:hypothetical protein